MTHGRKYGEKDSHPIPLWNGVFEHYEHIGDALWEFVWCLDAITKEHDGVGMVLGGSPVKLGVIVRAIKGRGKETVRRHLKMLVEGKYIRMRRTPYGQVIEVLNSKKFGIWKKEKPQNDVSLPKEKHIHEPEKHIHEPEKHQNDVSKEDSAVTQQEDSAVGRLPLHPVWSALGLDPLDLPPEFRELVEKLWPARVAGESLVEFMGHCLNSWQAYGGKRYPPVFCKRKSELAHSPAKSEPERPELEAIPWKKR